MKATKDQARRLAMKAFPDDKHASVGARRTFSTDWLVEVWFTYQGERRLFTDARSPSLAAAYGEVCARLNGRIARTLGGEP
jgi:hypothetical protein